MASLVVDFVERKAKKANEEAVAELLSLPDGGIVIVAEADGAEFIWELSRDQVGVLIAGLTLALKTRQSVRIVQPCVRSAA